MGRKHKTYSKLSPEREFLVLDNMKLVTFLIRRYVYIGNDEFEDLFQEGCVGLVKAAKYYDESRGIKFSTYASNMILGTIKRYQRDYNKYGGMHISRSIMNNMYKIDQLSNIGYTDEEIAAKLNITINDIEKTKIFISSTDSYINSSDIESITLGDMLKSDEKGYDEIISDESFDAILVELKEELSDTYYNIAEELIYTYTIGGEKITQNELSIKYNKSQPQISRIINRIKEALLKIIEEDNK